MSPATNKHQQLILLERPAAKLLDELAKETRVPKQVLLREAVNDLLAKHGKGTSAWYADIAMTLKAGLTILPFVNRLSRDTEDEAPLRAKCATFRNMANEVLAVLGKK